MHIRYGSSDAMLFQGFAWSTMHTTTDTQCTATIGQQPETDHSNSVCIEGYGRSKCYNSAAYVERLLEAQNDVAMCSLSGGEKGSASIL